MEIEAAHQSYKTALFYAKAALAKIEHLKLPSSFPRREALEIISETEKEMSTPGLKDYFYSACVRKWYNIKFYENFSSGESSRYSFAANALDKAYTMRDLHERSFLGEDVEDKLNASKRELYEAFSSYESKIPIL